MSIEASKPVPKASARVESIDWVKGALVFLMVVYHSLNYSPFSPSAFRHLAFLPPSFIFISGFLVTTGYLARSGTVANGVRYRLIFRGIKLVALFTFLNVAIVAAKTVPKGDYLGWLSYLQDNWESFYFAKAGRAASFYILVPIGYILILAPILVHLTQLWRWSLPVVAGLFFLVCLGAEWEGTVNYHMGMVGAGILGMAVGVVPFGAIRRLCVLWGLVIPCWLVYRGLSLRFGDPYGIQMLGVFTSLLLLMGIAERLSAEGYLYRQMVILGRYSLVGYLGQLAFLQLFAPAFRMLDRGPLLVVMNFAATVVATWAAILGLDRLRRVSPALDRGYKAIFG